MKTNSIHSQNPPSSTPPLSASQSTANSTKRYNSITDSLSYFNIYGSTNELIPTSINYICIYTLVEDTGEDIYKQILYYGTEETFRFEVKGGDNRKRSDALSLDLFKKDETSKVSQDRVDNSNNNEGGNSDIEDNGEDRGVSLRPRHGVPIELQERQVGLAQAIVNFSKTFSDTDISDNIHSQKHRLIIIEPEPKYFIVLSLNLGQKLRNSNTQKGSLVVDYLDYDLDDNLLKSWLTKSYQNFCVGHGSFSNIFNSQGKQSLVHNLEHFYDLYFSKHQSFTNLNLLKSLNKLELLYLSKSNYLYLKQIYSQLTSLNQRIDDSFIIFKGKLILNEFFTTNVSDPVIQYYSELFGEEFEFSEEMGHDGRNAGSVGGGNRQSMFQSWNPFKRYSTTSTSSTSVYSPNFQFLNLWDTTSADGDSEDSQYFKPQYLTNYDPKSPLQFNLQSKLVPESNSIVKKFYYNNGSEKLALIYSFAPHSYLVLTYNQDISPYLTQGYFEDLERLLQPILNDTLVQLLQKDYELYQQQRGELTTKKLEFFYWNLLNNVKEINFTNTLINNDDFRLVIEVIDKLKSQNTTNDLIVRTISKKRTLTNWILGKRINNEESILVLVVQRDSNIGDVEEEFRKLMNCYFNHLFLD